MIAIARPSRLWIALFCGLALVGPGQGAVETACPGQDLIAELPAGQRAALAASLAGMPFALGNAWRAQKGDEQATIVGTLHLDDGRWPQMMASLTPALAQAGLLLVEAGPDAQAALAQAIRRDPQLVLLPPGESLKPRLEPAAWDELLAALAARGMPAIMAHRLRPWMLMASLAVPPCAAQAMLAKGQTQPQGLDQRLVEAAAALGVPVESLEPWDAALRRFTELAAAQEIQLLSVTLATDSLASALVSTMAEAYFRGETQLAWAYYKQVALPGLIQTMTPKAAARFQADNAAAMALIEGPLLAQRNRAWLPVIDRAAAQTDKPLFIAFGALHLAGPQGVLALLLADGWAIAELRP